jgi:uncharacterized protein (TIGR02996 family)
VDPELEDILAAPDEDGPRLVWTDALLEKGDVRGELVVVQCALERGGLSREQAIAHRRREQELLSNALAWSGLEGIAKRVTYRRGFVDGITVDADVLLARYDEIFAKAPLLRRVHVEHLDYDDDDDSKGTGRIERVLSLERIRHLDLPAVARWVTPPWGELSSLETVDCTPEIVASLCRTRRLRSLVGLTLHSGGASILRDLAASPDAGGLDVLEIEGRFAELHAGFEKTVPRATSLRPKTVRLIGWHDDESLGATMFDCGDHVFWSRVSDLTVGRLVVSSTGALRSPLLASSGAARLRRLAGKLSFTAAEASMLDTPRLARLEELALAPAVALSKLREPIDLSPLFHARHLGSLRVLALGPSAGPEIARAVVASPLARRLEMIDLRGDRRIAQIRPELETAFDGVLLTDRTAGMVDGRA